MTEQEWLNLITQGEGQTVEFKREWTSEIAAELVSFANSRGGVLLVGVDDQTRDIVGVRPDEWARLETSLATACNNCKPPLRPTIEAVSVSGQRLLVARIERSLDVHSTSDGVTWLRVGSTKQRATPDELNRLLQDRGKLQTDEFPVEGAQFSDLQADKIMRYLEQRASPFASRLANGRPLTTIATSLGLARPQGDRSVPTMAGLLFFGHYPQQFIVHSALTALRFQGNDIAGRVVLDRANLEGTLDEIVQAAVAFVGRNMKVARHIGARSLELPEYPLNAVKEAIVNAVIHRDYTTSGRTVLLRMFDERLELESPGSLSGTLTLATLSIHHFARNRRLARIAQELGLAEQAGTGIPRMLYELALLGSPPPDFLIDEQTFTVRFWSRHRELAAWLAEQAALERGVDEA
jgi:predicted HTH transcriptional regulator